MITDIDVGQLVDDGKSLHDGALIIPGYQTGGWNLRLYSASGFYDPEKPIRKFAKKGLLDSLRREPVRMKSRAST